MDKISASRGARVVAAGIDMAKSTFSVCGLDAAHKVALERTVNRAKLMELLANMAPCIVGVEARSGAHQLARELSAMGHTVRIIAAKFVAPHRTSGKNDRNDARAIVDALIHPRTRFVPVKSEEQQALLSLQRARSGFVEERTALVNRIRGLLAITRHGDVYLRSLYVQCAKALLLVAARRKDHLSRWALAVRARRGFGQAMVAVAAKLARIAWAILAKGQRFRVQALAPAASR